MAKSAPNAVITDRVTWRARFTAGRAARNAAIAPLEIPRCPRGAVSYQEICYLPMGKLDARGIALDLDPSGNHEADLGFPGSQEANNYEHGIQVGLCCSIWLHEGSVESVLIRTKNGTDGQTEALELLRKRYGPPHRFKREVLQNLFGVKFIGYVAEWRFAGLSIDFDGTSSGLGGGAIHIYTPRSTESINSNKATRDKSVKSF